MRYANDLPIFAAFDAGAATFPGTLYAGVPTVLNAMMDGGELDMGPISAFAYAQNAKQYVLLPDLCIGARDELVSVVLVSHTPPALLAGVPIQTTTESASGRGLLRILLERRYGVRPLLIDCTDPFARAREGDAALMIGDAAIDAQEQFPREHIYDCLLYHSDAADDLLCVDLGGRRIIKKKMHSAPLSREYLDTATTKPLHHLST